MLELKENRCFVIAEAGTAHMGSVTRAMEYVECASQCGADAIKFQWFYHYHTSPLSRDFFCWIEGDEAREPRWRQSVMDPDEWQQVKEFADACGLTFLASAFQTRTVQWLIDLNLAATKVASRAAKTFPYETPGLPRPFLVSLGMLEGDIEHPTGDPDDADHIWLECEAKYPSTIAYKGGSEGFSDHSGKPFFGIDAISRGCRLLEVHFAIESIHAGPDLPACLAPNELKLICEARDYFHDRNSAR